jgi:hypothetical protein
MPDNSDHKRGQIRPYSSHFWPHSSPVYNYHSHVCFEFSSIVQNQQLHLFCGEILQILQPPVYRFQQTTVLRKTVQSDIFISVKTTKSNRVNRLQLLMDTWISLAGDEVCTKLSLENQQLHLFCGEILQILQPPVYRFQQTTVFHNFFCIKLTVWNLYLALSCVQN